MQPPFRLVSHNRIQSLVERPRRLATAKIHLAAFARSETSQITLGDAKACYVLLADRALSDGRSSLNIIDVNDEGADLARWKAEVSTMVVDVLRAREALTLSCTCDEINQMSASWLPHVDCKTAT